MMITPHDLVAAQLYESEAAVLDDAMRHLLRARADLRLNLAIYRYQTQGISLAKAASEAGISWAQMRDLLIERGVPLSLGPADANELESEVQVLRTFLDETE